MLGERQTRGQQPQLDVAAQQKLRHFAPLRIEQRLATRQQRHACPERFEIRQHAVQRIEGQIVAAVPPVVARDTA
jgi:hypothetical protein